MRSFVLLKHCKKRFEKSILHDLCLRASLKVKFVYNKNIPAMNKFKVALLAQSTIWQCDLNKR